MFQQAGRVKEQRSVMALPGGEGEAS
jgi:hypothetical protein